MKFKSVYPRKSLNVSRSSLQELKDGLAFVFQKLNQQSQALETTLELLVDFVREAICLPFGCHNHTGLRISEQNIFRISLTGCYHLMFTSWSFRGTSPAGHDGGP